MKQALLIFAVLLFFGTVYGLWYEHEQIVGLQTQVTGLEVSQRALSARESVLTRNQKVFNSNQKTLNDNQQELAKEITLLLKYLTPDTDPKSDNQSYRVDKLPKT